MKFDVSSDTINKLFDQGFEEQIVDIVMQFENETDKCVSDIPISPFIIQDNGEEIIISEEIYTCYQEFIKRINDPKTAEEIPFVLVGNRKKNNGKSYIVLEKIEYSISDDLSDLCVKLDAEKIERLIKDSQYSVIAIGHTHGNVDDSKKRQVLASQLSQNLIDKYQIRDVGLNLSIADIDSHQIVVDYAERYGNKEILQTVIMYNGDMVILGSKGINKCSSVTVVLNNGNVISISTGSIENMNKKI